MDLYFRFAKLNVLANRLAIRNKTNIYFGHKKTIFNPFGMDPLNQTIAGKYQEKCTAMGI